MDLGQEDNLARHCRAFGEERAKLLFGGGSALAQDDAAPTRRERLSCRTTGSVPPPVELAA